MLSVEKYNILHNLPQNTLFFFILILLTCSFMTYIHTAFPFPPLPFPPVPLTMLSLSPPYPFRNSVSSTFHPCQVCSGLCTVVHSGGSFQLFGGPRPAHKTLWRKCGTWQCRTLSDLVLHSRSCGGVGGCCLDVM